MIGRRSFLNYPAAILLAQAAPPVGIFKVNEIQKVFTLLRDIVTDAAAAGVVTAQVLSLVTDWYQQASATLQVEGITQQIDTVLVNLTNQLNDTDRAFVQPYVSFIILLRTRA